MKYPKVSIGLPVFNGAAYLEHALRSILLQDYPNLELVISDNASTDDTERICTDMAALDPRVRYYRNSVNIGAAGNYNRVFELSEGEYFKWQAHDDECHPEMVRKCVELLLSSPESVAMVYPRAELIDESGNVLVKGLDRITSSHHKPYVRMAKVLRGLNMCDPIFGVIKSSYLRRTGLIGPFFGADNVLLSELAMLGEIRELDEILFRLRAHKQRSMKAHKTARARATWYDPSAATKLFVLPGWERMVFELMKGAGRSSLPLGEKLMCTLTIPTVHYWQRFRNAGGRWKRAIRNILPWRADRLGKLAEKPSS